MLLIFGCDALDNVNYFVLAALTEPIGTPVDDVKMIKLHTLVITHYFYSYRIDYKLEVHKGLHTGRQNTAQLQS